MPPQGQEPPPTPFGFVMGVIQKGGKTAAVCAFVCGLGLMGLGVTSMISFHSVLAGATTFFQGIFCFGAGFGIASISFHANRATQISTTAAAEANIDRALIANAVTPPEVTIIPKSADPAIQREIVKQLATTSLADREAERQTPPLGTAVLK